jgi:hypothetical protein
MKRSPAPFELHMLMNLSATSFHRPHHQGLVLTKPSDGATMTASIAIEGSSIAQTNSI